MHNMKNVKNEFKLANLPAEVRDPSISKDDFKLVQKNTKIHDQKFETKPTTFFKDCVKRFAKNKSSVVATVILGILLVMSIAVPIFAKTSIVHETDSSHPELYYLEPKLFKAGTGFWDGTRKYTNIAADCSSDNPDEWGPNKKTYNPNAVYDLKIEEESYINNASKFAKGGYLQYGYFDVPEGIDYVAYSTNAKIEEFELDGSFYISNFVTVSSEDLKTLGETVTVFPEGYEEAESALYFTFSQNMKDYEIKITDYAVSHNVSQRINITELFEEAVDDEGSHFDEKINNPKIEIRVKADPNKSQACALVQSIKIECFAGKSEQQDTFKAYSFASGNEVMSRLSTEAGYWINANDTRYSKNNVYLVRARLCSFTYDTYEAVLGKTTYRISITELDSLQNKGYIKYNIPRRNSDGTFNTIRDGEFECKILNYDKCPLISPFTIEDVEFTSSTGLPNIVNVNVYRYKMNPYNLTKMPKFLLGTDVSGRDMFIYVFEGLRTSLLLGIATTIVCFLFGLFWGSVSGYFGGTVDLVMERFTDILAGVPWVVVMTLTIIKLGSNFFTFALALCLTGWIGTAATTRTQFYRFRGREYVLASRTLGASHGRLIARHILPNAMGTIITSAVLMVPSVIFSEATISYLGLGFKNLASLGVILSDNQIELTNHPYLLIFPSIIIALLMISFNLFGNGLRDAVNPSLKGEGE